MGDKRFQFYARNGMEKVPIDTDGEVTLETADGQQVSLQYRRSDGEINVSVHGRAGVRPIAANCFRVEDLK